MGRTARTGSIWAAIVMVALAALLAGGLASVRQAQADDVTLKRHALPLTEPSLQTDSSKLTGADWMSGVSGAFYLHEINIPGTHDSCMYDPYTRHQIQKTQYSYAKTQDTSMDIKSQLNAGVRLFDIRLTNVYCRNIFEVSFLGSESQREWGKEGLYPVHGKHMGWKGDWRYYGDVSGGVLTFETIMGWYTEFLRDHPTETLILDISYESNSGNKDITLKRIGEYLEKYYTTKNPKTGKPYIYTENGSKTITTMPQLSDCRGQIVVISSDAINLGMHYDWTDNWNSKDMGGVHFASENHYECTMDEKWEYVKGMLFGGLVNGNQQYNDPKISSGNGASTGMSMSVESAPLDHGIVASTGSNRPPAVTDSPHQDPKEIAEMVNPLMYGEGGYLTHAGTHCGWVMSDFVTNDTVKTYWKTNFPSELAYATVTYKASEMGYADKTYNVLSGSKIVLPASPFAEQAAAGSSKSDYRIVGWTVNGEDYGFGDTVEITGNTDVVARVEMSWKTFQGYIDNAAKSGAGTIDMEYDVVGLPSDAALVIPTGAKITINMNGHTIDRASKAYGSSRVFTVDGELALSGPGTVTGGFDNNGGGIMVDGTLLVTGDVTIRDNRATRWGGGVYVASGASFTMEGGSIASNIASQGGGVALGFAATFTMRDNISIVGSGSSIVGNNAMVGAGVNMFDEKSKFNVSSKVSVTGNIAIPSDTEITADTPVKTEGDQQNVRLYMRTYVTVNGALHPDSRIGVTKVYDDYSTALRVATWAGVDGATDESYVGNFMSDQSKRCIVKMSYGAGLSNGVAVTFDTDGGSEAPAAQLVGIGGKATKPADPTRGKYIFEHWYNAADPNRAEFDFAKATVQEAITLKAKWSPAPQTVTFHVGSGEPDITQQVAYGSKATPPDPAPTREGATLSGWYMRVSVPGLSGGIIQPYDFDRPVLRDADLYARWSNDTHTVTFDTAGGSEVAQQTVTYGQVAPRPADPVLEGSTFAGWFTDEGLQNAYSFSTPVKSDITLYAKWVPARYTVAFETNGGTAVDAQSVAAGECAVKPTTTRENCEFTGWFLASAFAGAPYGFNAPVEGDLVLYAQWNIPVTFDAADGSAPTTQMVASGAQAVRPADPVRDGYLFDGWYAQNAPYDFDAAVDAPVALTAHWAERPAEPKTFVVVFDSFGGSAYGAAYVQENGKIAKPDSDPTRVGYAFDGWYADADFSVPYDFNAPVTGDLLLFAKWNPANHEVSLDYGEGQVAGPYTIDHGATLEAPEEPARDGNLFAGWYKNPECTVPFDFSKPVVDDLTLYAKWVPMRYDVTFVANGGTDVPAQSVVAGASAAVPEEPTRDGCTFGGWYADGAFSVPYDFESSVNADMVLYAKWTADVSFDTGCDTAIPSAQIAYGQAVGEPTETLVKGGFSFEGWFIDSGVTFTEEELAAIRNEIAADSSFADSVWIVDGSVRIVYDFDEPVDRNITLYARWSGETHNVEFDADGGSAVDGISGIADGATISEPAVPAREGYAFGGWFLDTAFEYPFDFSEPVYGDLILHAKWIEVYCHVQFVTDCDASVAEQLVRYGEKASKPEDPANEGFSFGGWYADGGYETAFDFDATAITQDTVLYASWSEAPHAPSAYTVTFVDEEAAGGSAPAEAQTVAEGQTATRPENDPVSEHAAFDDWYIEIGEELTDEQVAQIADDPELADIVWVVGNKARIPYDFDSPVDQDLTIYACWNYENYLVTFVNQGDELFADVVRAGDTVASLEFDNADDATFDGWFTDEALTQPYDFSQPVTADLTLYSKWTQKSHTVSFKSNGGSEVASQEVAYGGLASVPADPVREGYTFIGWYADMGVKLGADELAEIKEAEKDFGFEFSNLLWQTDETTFVKCDLANEPIYDDLELQALWEDNQAAASAVEELIEALPSADEVMADALVDVEAVQTAYDMLNDAQKALVSDDAKAKLAAVSIAAYAAARQAAADEAEAAAKEAARIDISAAAITTAKATYNGKALTPKVAVKVGAKTLVVGVDYTLTYANNKNAGTGVAIVSGKGDYKGVTFKTFTIAKAKNPIVAKARTVKVKAAKVSKKSVKLARKKAIALSKAQGKVTYKKVKGTKKIAVAAKTGKVTVKKGIKKGTYKVKVQVTAAGNNNYQKRTRTVIFKVKVR